MVLYGLGMGLTSAPATESIMGAVSRRQAGVGSAVNDSTRLLGGTLGVAVIGSVYASLYGSRLTASLPAGLPAPGLGHRAPVARRRVRGGRPGARPAWRLGRAVHDAATNAFIHGLSIGCLVAGGVAAAGAILAVLFLPAQPASPAVHPAAGPPRRGRPTRTVRASEKDGSTGAGQRPAGAGGRYGRTSFANWAMQLATALRSPALAMQLSNVVKTLVLSATNVPKRTAYTTAIASAMTPHTIPAMAWPEFVAPLARPRQTAMPPRIGRDQASQQGEREQDEGHGGHQAGHAENQGGHAQAVPRPGCCWRGKRRC